MQKFLILPENIRETKAEIADQDARHILKVLRLKKGDPVHLTDGMGMDFKGMILETHPSKVLIELVEKTASKTESPLQITVCSGMLKHQKMDTVIKHLTQMGIYQWIPFFCERSIPKPESKGLKKRMQRWQAIVKESVKQCRRSRLVAIHPPVHLDAVFDLSHSFDRKIAFWEESNRRLTDMDSSGQPLRVMILIGPEGGFSEQEIHQAKKKGFQSYSLGPRILRAETASICACSLVQHILGDM